jgi:hypothetical protein
MARKQTGKTAVKKKVRSLAGRVVNSVATRSRGATERCVVEAAHPAGRLIPDPGHFEAQEEAKTRCGGYEAMLAPPGMARRIKDQNNVMGYAIGAKSCDGRLSPVLAVKVFVRKKVPKSHVSSKALVPTTINGYPTDVVEVRPIHALASPTDDPPFPCGTPIVQLGTGEEGTLGCLVVTDGKYCVLSCNHVLANLNQANQGDVVNFHDVAANSLTPIANLWKWINLVLDDSTQANLVDVAVANVLPNAVCPGLIQIPLNEPPRDAAVLDQVTKSGANTPHVTLGRVESVNAEIPVIMTGRAGGVPVHHTAIFARQILIRGDGGPFCDDGDSGSAVLLVGTNQPVGLLFAGDPSVGYFANPIRTVIELMNITRIPALVAV